MTLVDKSWCLFQRRGEAYGETKMRKAVVAGIVGVGLLTGCGIAPAGNKGPDALGKGKQTYNITKPAVIKFTKSGSETVLIGTVSTGIYSGSKSKDGYVVKIEQSITASNGELRCQTGIGSASTEKLKILTMEAYTTTIQCSNGKTGRVSLTAGTDQYKTGQVNASGFGTGKMKDGSNVRIIYGETAANMMW